MRKHFANSSNYGKLVLIIGLLLIIPLVILPFYPEERKYAIAFIIPSLFSIILGICLCLFSKQDDTTTHWQLTMQKGSLTVLFAWMYGFLAGAIPFVISNKLSFIQALFEAVSGWTTTGLSVMDVSVTPHIFLFHRSFMQFCGGLGFVMVMIMFIQGKQSMNLYNAEGHPDKLMPNLKKTAQAILLMYVSLLAIGTIVYTLFGMKLFDSVCHAMCALSTGGFSNKLGSIGEYSSFSIEVITIILMLIGTTNFAVLLLIVKRKFKQVFRIGELRFMFGLLLVFVPIIAISLSNGLDMGIGESSRRALFDAVSALSTTGYSTMAYNEWPSLAIGSLILLMLIGGGLGSTAGGMKLTRVYIMLRTTLGNMRMRLSPEHNIEAPYYYKAQGKTPIDQKLTNDITGFIACYTGIFVVGTFLLTITANCSLTEAMFEFASSLGTVGLSIGLTGPATNAATLIVEIVGMILGRLEIFIVLIGIYSGFSILKEKIGRKIRK